MADEADLGNDAMQRDLDLRLAEVRARQRTGGPEFCEDCDLPMPRLRRDMGLIRCVECADFAERAARLFKRR